jgi:Rad3-related DNA helicase
MASWQVILKVPYPSLADPVIAEWAQRDHEAYSWETLKEMIQATGRVCRGPTDVGVTYVFDKSFERLHDGCAAAGLIPTWWADRLRWRDVS